VSQKKKSPNKHLAAKPQQSVFKEAWGNMNNDFNRVLPEKLRNRDKKKFALWLFILELIILGGVGTLVYRWLTGH